jgi:hypothetical protein
MSWKGPHPAALRSAQTVSALASALCVELQRLRAKGSVASRATIWRTALAPVVGGAASDGPAPGGGVSALLLFRPRRASGATAAVAAKMPAAQFHGASPRFYLSEYTRRLAGSGQYGNPRKLEVGPPFSYFPWTQRSIPHGGHYQQGRWWQRAAGAAPSWALSWARGDAGRGPGRLSHVGQLQEWRRAKAVVITTPAK